VPASASVTLRSTPSGVTSDLSSLERVTVGGAAVPRTMIERFHERYGIEIIQGWGMTETSPVGALSLPPAGVVAWDEQLDWRAKTGRVFAGILALYRDLIRLRRDRDGTTGGLRGQNVNVHHVNDDDNVIASYDKSGKPWTHDPESREDAAMASPRKAYSEALDGARAVLASELGVEG
jgi:acyl-CoA synthetase (AMP-forming)/AMP-acid ligase II